VLVQPSLPTILASVSAEERVELSESLRRSLFLRTPQNPDELWHLVRVVLGFTMGRVPVCEDHQAPFDFLSAAYFEKFSLLLAMAAKTSGKTRLFSVLHHLNSAHKPGTWTAHIGAIEAQAQRGRDYLNEQIRGTGMLGKDVEELYESVAVEGEPSRSLVRWKNTSRVEVRSGTLNGVSGMHPAKGAMDELELADEVVWSHFTKCLKSTPQARAQLITGSTRFRKAGLVDRVANAGRFKVFQWCVPPDTLVVQADGTVSRIDALVPGDAVLTRRGRARLVQRVLSRPYAGDLVVLHVRGLPARLRLTPEHRLPTRRGWIRAEEIQPGDRVFDPGIALSDEGGPSWLDGWLVGFYLAEGVLVKKGTGVRFGVHEREARGVLDRLHSWWRPLSRRQERNWANRAPRVAQRRGRCVTIEACHPDLRKLIETWTLGTARTKQLLTMPTTPEFASGVLDGWLDGDGWHAGSSRAAQSASPALAWQMFRLATGLGEGTSLRYPNRPGLAHRERPAADAWRVTLLRSRAPRAGGPEPEGGGAWRHVDHVMREPYTGEVWDLTVQEDHTFVAAGVAVSNCVYDAMARCDKDCFNVPDFGMCPLYKRTEQRADGTTDEVMMCAGKAHHGTGHLTWDEVVTAYLAEPDPIMWGILMELRKPGAEGMFFPTFDDREDGAHVKSTFEYVAGREVYLGYDDGFAWPLCLGAWQVRPDGFLYQFEELYGERLLPEQVCDWLLDRPWLRDVQKGWPDPSAHAAIETYRQFFLRVLNRPVMSWNTDNTRKDGWKACRRRFRGPDGRTTIGFHPRCKGTIADLAGLMRNEHDLEDCQKKRDHGADQARYLIYNLERELGWQDYLEGRTPDHATRHEQQAREANREAKVEALWNQLRSLGYPPQTLDQLERRANDRTELIRMLGSLVAEHTIAGRMARAGLTPDPGDEE